MSRLRAAWALWRASVFTGFWLWNDWRLDGYCALGGAAAPMYGSRQHNEIMLQVGPLFLAYTWFPQ